MFNPAMVTGAYTLPRKTSHFRNTSPQGQAIDHIPGSIAECVTTIPTSKPVTVPSSSCLYRLKYNRYKFWALPNTSMCNSDIVFGSEYATQYCSELITENICLLKNNNKIIYFLKSTLASSDIFIWRPKTHKNIKK